MRHYPPGHPASVCQSRQHKLARAGKRKTGQWEKGQPGYYCYTPPHSLRCSNEEGVTNVGKSLDMLTEDHDALSVCSRKI